MRYAIWFGLVTGLFVIVLPSVSAKPLSLDVTDLVDYNSSVKETINSAAGTCLGGAGGSGGAGVGGNGGVSNSIVINSSNFGNGGAGTGGSGGNGGSCSVVNS